MSEKQQVNRKTARQNVDKPKNAELEQKLAQRYQIQEFLHKARNYGVALFVVNVIYFLAGCFMRVSALHPYFTRTILPEFVVEILQGIGRIMFLPTIMIWPISAIIYYALSIGAAVFLGFSIYRLRQWRKLQLSEQKYGIAVQSIVYNALCLIPMIALTVFIIWFLSWWSGPIW